MGRRSATSHANVDAAECLVPDSGRESDRQRHSDTNMAHLTTPPGHPGWQWARSVLMIAQPDACFDLCDDAGGQLAILADMEEVEVVIAYRERATLRVGDVFLKIDSDQARTDVEVEAMARTPAPTPEIPWRRPPVLALAALPGAALGHLGQPSTASPATWAAAGTAARALDDAALPPGRRTVRSRHPHPRTPRTPRRRRRRLRHRRRP